MDKKQYYKNKIQYALQKIDFALARMKNKDPDNLLSKIYLVMENYTEIDYLTITRVLQDVPEAKIRKAIKYLQDLGVLTWEGKKLTEGKMVKVQQKDYSTFIKELEGKMKVAKGKDRLNLSEIQEIFKQADTGNHSETRAEPKVEQEPEKEDWVEIPYSKDVFIRCKKSKLKRLLE